MPWRNTGWLQDALLALSAGGAVMMGLLAKIAHEVKMGHRPRFFTRRLWLDVPALAAMVAVAAGINVYFELEGWPGSAVGVVCGWLGPRSIDVMLMAVAERVRGGR
ncbi:hypothetical protein [Halomonas nitroreducens]|uniref:Holin n=1 Tax=Halomonas nitroreducens TaxID=447425 RepID=A0A3S0JWR3_9GAMM|nr:hypothetical protein [Halomonas nitroreducens]RTR01953.1 hypothetical protein EKG36_13170 [Halomonas nitroreducens]